MGEIQGLYVVWRQTRRSCPGACWGRARGGVSAKRINNKPRILSFFLVLSFFLFLYHPPHSEVPT